jgi:hypothetical protein
MAPKAQILALVLFVKTLESFAFSICSQVATHNLGTSIDRRDSCLAKATRDTGVSAPASRIQKSTSTFEIIASRRMLLFSPFIVPISTFAANADDDLAKLQVFIRQEML